MLHTKLIARSIAAALAVSVVAAACASDDATDAADTTVATEATEGSEAMEVETEDTEATEVESNTIVDVASSNDDFSILVEAVVAADLVDALSADGELTVFAPTNEAFEAFLIENDLTKAELLANPDLADILKGHVLASKVDGAAALEAATAGSSVETLQGGELLLSLDGEDILVANATVVTPDVEASNGIIHAIDQVIPLPA